MFNLNDPETFWLTTTNLVLGLVVLACILIVGRAVFQEVRQRIANRSVVPATEKQALVLPFVGTTMADGGEPITDRTRPMKNASPTGTDSSRPTLSEK